MKTKNNCIQPKENISTRKITANEIIIEGIKYYYSINQDTKGIIVYEKSKNEGSYIISKDLQLSNIVLENINKLKLKDSL